MSPKPQQRRETRRMRRARGAVAGILTLAAGSLFAQQGSPYAGQEARAVKSLSEQELLDLEAGAGMGFAKPAELNGYPGPRHVLELAEALELEPAQRRRAQESFDRMQLRAIAAGRELVAAELALDALFADARADASTLAAAVERAAAARGRLRLTHLEAHLEMRELLSDAQAETYARLRGYHGRAHDPSKHHPPGSH